MDGQVYIAALNGRLHVLSTIVASIAISETKLIEKEDFVSCNVSCCGLVHGGQEIVIDRHYSC